MSKMSDFFFSEDITYCMDGECLRTECVRHRSRAPIGVPLSWANMKYQEGCLLEKIKALPSAKDIDVSNKVRKKMMMSDLISREAAIKLILSGRVGEDSLVECPEECNGMLEWAAAEVAKMPATERLEPLTDKEQRIFLAAMGREEKICEEVDRNCVREPYEDSLMRVCKEIRRKVKGSLWT